MPQNKRIAFGIFSDPSLPKSRLNLNPAVLTYNGGVTTMEVEAHSVLYPCVGKPTSGTTYHFSGYAAIAYAWETTESWSKLTTFNLTNCHMEQHSLGDYAVPEPYATAWQKIGLNPADFQIAGLFSSVNFRATTVILDGLSFVPDDTSNSVSVVFAQSLAVALKENMANNNNITAVSLAGITTPTAKGNSRFLQAAQMETLCNDFSNITFTFG
jgi:hypothetical protein